MSSIEIIDVDDDGAVANDQFGGVIDLVNDGMDDIVAIDDENDMDDEVEVVRVSLPTKRQASFSEEMDRINRDRQYALYLQRKENESFSSLESVEMISEPENNTNPVEHNGDDPKPKRKSPPPLPSESEPENTTDNLEQTGDDPTLLYALYLQRKENESFSSLESVEMISEPKNKTNVVERNGDDPKPEREPHLPLPSESVEMISEPENNADNLEHTGDDPKPERKSPPPLTDLENIKERIVTISQRLHHKKKVSAKNILKEALAKHKAYCRKQKELQTPCPLPVSQAASIKLDYINADTEPTKIGHHTTIVNSSSTVISTFNDEKIQEEIKRKEIHGKAEALSLMPYQYKIIEEDFIQILQELPFEQRYHPQVHEFVGQLLYTPPAGGDSTIMKFEVPDTFKKAPEKATTNDTGDEHDGNSYESVMKSFRDFCVQCKTFDCQVHITSYPDAATQACIAIQCDVRASQRQNEKEFQPNSDDDPTTDITCPFCGFSCFNTKKLSRHLARYHQDTHICKEDDTKISAIKRTKENETMKPKREYYHSRSLIPIEPGHFDRDSDDESNYSWYQDYRQDLLKDLTDVTDNEKELQGMWNRFIGCSPAIIADKDIPQRCFDFVCNFFVELQALEWELYQLFITFWERHLITIIHVQKLIHRFRIDSVMGCMVLSSRKRMILSRLHLMFQSLGGDTTSRLSQVLNISRQVAENITSTPCLPKPSKLERNRSINPALRMRTGDISRPFFFPCSHAGRCSLENGCTCLDNDNVCTKHCIWGEYGDNFFPGCICQGDCSAAKQCPCRDASRECDPDICRCSASKEGCRKSCGCSNMAVSLAKRTPLLVGRSLVEGAGLGVFTKNALKKGDYIDEYIGEFIKGEYQLGRNEEYYFDHSDDYILDATHQGNKTRYLNHSLTPNIEANHRFVNGEKRIAFYAKHDIPAQAELFYSYGKSYNKIWHSKGLSHLCVGSDNDSL